MKSSLRTDTSKNIGPTPQVDSDAFTLTMMEGIIDYWKDEATAITKYDMSIVTKCGQKKIQNTTVVWQLLVQWRDQSESWIHLKDLKKSHPIEAADFAKARGITDEPTFSWWVPCTMQNMDIIISALMSHI